MIFLYCQFHRCFTSFIFNPDISSSIQQRLCGFMPLMTDGTVPVVGETLSEPAPGVNDAAKASEDVIGF